MRVPIGLFAGLLVLHAFRGVAIAESLSAPKADSQCHGSPGRLGSDNIPNGQGLATTIINIAYFKGKDSKTVGWLYETVAGKFWFQANLKEADELQRATSPGYFGELTRRQFPFEEVSLFSLIPNSRLPAFVDNLKKHGIQISPCYTAPYSP
jgi:hypothetical protein